MWSLADSQVTTHSWLIAKTGELQSIDILYVILCNSSSIIQVKWFVALVFFSFCFHGSHNLQSLSLLCFFIINSAKYLKKRRIRFSWAAAIENSLQPVHVLQFLWTAGCSIPTLLLQLLWPRPWKVFDHFNPSYWISRSSSLYALKGGWKKYRLCTGHMKHLQSWRGREKEEREKGMSPGRCLDVCRENRSHFCILSNFRFMCSKSKED